MYSLAIFDLDGTLLDTLGDLHSAVNFALRKFRFPERSLEEIRTFIGNGVVKLMERSTPDGTDPVIQRKCLDIFRKHYLSHMADTTSPYEGVTELLKSLRGEGIKIAVVSNKLHPAVEDLCESYFPGLIDKAVGVSVEDERKPSPINVLKTLGHFGTDRYSAVYIGDSEVDVQTAHNAELKCIGVTWGFRSKDELVTAGADFIADTCSQVKEIILI
ncbi:MAG: HAD family hydrolase [Clostridia bacterium]|nr:HAD family hydrolase [Clostridia bacterium]